MYNDGGITIIYENGDLHVKIRSSWINNFFGKVNPSCEESISFDYDEQETFEFNEKKESD